MPKRQKEKSYMKIETRIEARVSLSQKKKITQIAEKCGLPLSEYIRQRALGYSPRTVLPDTFYDFHAKLCELCNSIDSKVSADVEEQLLQLIDKIQSELLIPGKETATQIKTELEDDKQWQPQDSGQSKGS